MAADALEQAEYFYERMMETLKIPSEFRFNTNAFIMSGRNITRVLQKEFSKNAKFQSWYAQKQEKIGKEGLMDFFEGAGNMSVKERPLRSASSAYIRQSAIKKFPEDVKNAPFVLSEEGQAFWITKNEEGKEEQIHASEFDNEIALQYYFVNPQPPQTFRNLQVIELCGLYLTALRDLVKEALKIARD